MVGTRPIRHVLLPVACSVVLALPVQAFAQVTYDLVADLASIGGARPLGGVTIGADGALYGTASEGGAENCGLVYRLDAAGQLSAIHEFSRPDGCRLVGELALGPDGGLYGVTSRGGLSSEQLPSGAGTIFKIGADGTFAVLYRFDPPPPQLPGEPEPFLAPFWPAAGLTLAPDGFFYGTLASNDVFRISPDGGAFGLVHQFASDGDPQALDAALVVGPDGNLYSTSLGFLIIVPRDRGTVFRVNLSGDPEVLRRFLFLQDPLTGTPFSPEGGLPAGELAVGPDGALYGANRQYGPDAVTDRGTIFRLGPDGTFSVLHAFSRGPDQSYLDGATPVGGLIAGADGEVYGKTLAGGEDGNGTIFRISSDGVFTTLLSFPQDGYTQTKGRLLETAPGVFYGTSTSETGGVVYRLQRGNESTRLKLVFPHPHARLRIGTTQPIRWIHNLGADSAVSIELSRDNGATWELIAPTVENATKRVGRFSWLVTGPATRAARLRITSLSTGAVAISKRPFSLVPPRDTSQSIGDRPRE